MKRYHDRWIGAMVVAVLIATLVAVAPSRITHVLGPMKRDSAPNITWIEVPTSAAASPGRPAAPPPRQEPRGTAPPSAVTPPPTAASPPAPRTAADRMFTVDFGSFVDEKTLEQAEQRLREAGAETVRHREAWTVPLYAVQIGEFSTAEEASTALREIQARHPAVPLGEIDDAGTRRITTTPEARLPLRAAVAFAAALRRDGFPVRLRTIDDAGRPAFGLRLKGSYDRATADARRRELERQGFHTSIVGLAPTSSL